MKLIEPNDISILIVDDNPTNLQVLSEAIDSHRWTVLLAVDGESAIEQSEYAQPDLILLDVMMPGIDGFETCRRLKANAKTCTIPVIFMTALSETSNKVQGLELGAVDYITKPFQQEEVLARVNLHLKLHHLNRHLESQNEQLHQSEAQLQQLAQELEHRVEARTVELSTSLDQLKEAQLQLVQHEKMSTLGNMMAGIAHEINNPVGFLSGNLQPAQDYVNDLFGLIDLYQQKYPTPDADIEAEIDKIDLPFIREDLIKLLKSMATGVERIGNISTSLRMFSRADKAHKVLFDLHEGLDSTLLILKHRLKADEKRPAIKIIKQYGEIPPIECFAGQLNQVFMNLLANAIDALDEAISNRPGNTSESPANQITVSTRFKAEQQRVQITIRDNGIGMPADIRQQIFEHLFTTKAVGKGTGLGLAIARQIVVDNHGGKIEVESTVGEGTEFVISLPV
ncbi:MAG: response regulator [Cyanobacteria bacterium P01_G01_bin.38]